MRLFLAQSAALDDYSALQARFDPCIKGRWRTETSLHATVLFLGKRFEAEEIITTVSKCSYALKDAPLAGVGRFAHNRIFYAAAVHPTLVETYHTLSEAFSMAHSRPYLPHITLMRYKAIDTVCFENKCEKLGERRLGTVGGPLKLIKSTLTPEGAVYKTIYEF
jgi:2'-5' RNA ligase